MSRSRRKHKLGPCCCGLGLVAFIEYGRGAGCSSPVMEDVHAENAHFLRYRSDRHALARSGDEPHDP
jgi:hypothetical protein